MATQLQRIQEPRVENGTDQKIQLNELEKRLLDIYQKGFPLSPTPFAEIADRIGTSEALVLKLLDRLQRIGVISRIGPVFRPKRIGTSTLAALSVPEAHLQEIAALISAFPEVNHNYEREHHYNLWFVVTAPDQQHLERVLTEMERITGCQILDLPLERQFHIDLGFPLWC